MDITLILILLALVIAIGYILSRPFLGTNHSQNNADMLQTYQTQYKSLLQEIKTLQTNWKTNTDTTAILAELEEKKELAANLLRLIQSSSKGNDPSTEQESNSREQNFQMNNKNQHNGSYTCPKCGNQVVFKDKYCPSCGYHLKH